MLKEDQSLNLNFQIQVTNISYNDLSHGKKKQNKTTFLKSNSSFKQVRQDKLEVRGGAWMCAGPVSYPDMKISISRSGRQSRAMETGRDGKEWKKDELSGAQSVSNSFK